MKAKLASGITVSTECVGAWPTHGDVKCYPSNDCVLPDGLPDDYFITLTDAELSGTYEIAQIEKRGEGDYALTIRYTHGPQRLLLSAN